MRSPTWQRYRSGWSGQRKSVEECHQLDDLSHNLGLIEADAAQPAVVSRPAFARGSDDVVTQPSTVRDRWRRTNFRLRAQLINRDVDDRHGPSGVVLAEQSVFGRLNFRSWSLSGVNDSAHNRVFRVWSLTRYSRPSCQPALKRVHDALHIVTIDGNEWMNKNRALSQLSHSTAHWGRNSRVSHAKSILSSIMKYVSLIRSNLV